jgi:drug/metabolite transporter (DMT)-like permease
MHHRRPNLDLFAIGALILLCLSWGLQQVAVKIALTSVPPLTQMAVRSAGASLMLLAWCAVTGRGGLCHRDGSLGWGVLAGAFFTVEFILIYLGLQWTDASRSAVFLYTAPFFVALGAVWLLPNERLSPLQWAGLLVSFAGVALALGGPQLAWSQALVGDLMILGAGALWGATTLLIRASPLRQIQPEKVLTYQLVVSALGAALAAVLSGETPSLPEQGEIWWAMVYQTVWVAGLSFLIWFRLLSTYPAGQLQAGTSLTPLCGIASAWLILGEPISLPFAVSALLIVLGLVLVNRPKR